MDEDQLILESDSNWIANTRQTKQRKKRAKRVNNKKNDFQGNISLEA